MNAKSIGIINSNVFIGGCGLIRLSRSAKGLIHVREMPYDALGRFCGGLATVHKNGKWGYINRKFKVVIPMLFDMANNFCNNRALVRLGHKWGFIDKRGKFTIKPIFDELKGHETTFYWLVKGKELFVLKHDGSLVDKIERDSPDMEMFEYRMWQKQRRIFNRLQAKQLKDEQKRPVAAKKLTKAVMIGTTNLFDFKLDPKRLDSFIDDKFKRWAVK